MRRGGRYLPSQDMRGWILQHILCGWTWTVKSDRPHVCPRCKGRLSRNTFVVVARRSYLPLDRREAVPGAAFFGASPLETTAFTEPGSTTQTISEPGSSPSMPATTCGMVVRSDSVLSKARKADDRYSAIGTHGIRVEPLKDFVPGVSPKTDLRLISNKTIVVPQVVPTWPPMPELLIRDERANRGLLIAAQSDENIRHVETYHWHVRSQSPHPPGEEPTPLCGSGEVGWYCVTKLNGAGWACQCRDAFSGHLCKHSWACEISARLHTLVSKDATSLPPPPPREAEVLDDRPRCPACFVDTRITWSGSRTTKDGRSRQRYLCHACGKRFVIDDGEARLRYSPDLVIEVFCLYMRGLSIRAIGDHFVDIGRREVSKTTVERWVDKVGALLDHYSRSLNLDLGPVRHADETTLNVRRGQKDEKDRWRWVWNHMDRTTRYWLASFVGEGKGKGVRTARASIQEAQRNAHGSRPVIYITDGLADYRKAMSKEFARRNQPNPHVVGLPIRPGSDLHPSNNRMERLQGTQRDRTRTMRGVETVESGQAKVNGIRAHYNLIRRHSALEGQTPAEAAGALTPVMAGKSRSRALLVAAVRLKAKEDHLSGLPVPPPAPEGPTDPSAPSAGHQVPEQG